jgi:hypothetical protein
MWFKDSLPSYEIFRLEKWLHKKEELDEVANVCFITPNVLVLFCLFVFPFINVRWCDVG